MAFSFLYHNFYELWELGLSNRLAWKCNTKIILQHYLDNISTKHIDLGVGSGYYLPFLPNNCDISILDANPKKLEIALIKMRNKRLKQIIHHDVYSHYPSELHGKFNSASMYYLLHCLPGSMESKIVVIENAKKLLSCRGTLFGATILGSRVTHNLAGKKLTAYYNKKGIYSNEKDSADELYRILSTNFLKVSLNVEGSVAFFSASQKYI
ncbi:SAM-dependent methyltransferase [Citrobacter werkmanii]|uniref:SAM-dependent methyltransferase n=1 Tax=Citrobacter werkmanii TaxID=67827 RepID=UPI001288B44A|nr:SAM-dependent methyltransferase [Salmonella enterica]EAZ9261403.1 SAM-dependent methyltransferase [Salmonella enterica]EBN2521040.1 SAM-dependent methyltransferase [Salmonella enterica]